jgi:hypothetical protein
MQKEIEFIKKQITLKIHLAHGNYKTARIKKTTAIPPAGGMAVE